MGSHQIIGGLKRSVQLVDTGPEINWVPGQDTYTSTGRALGAPHPKRIIVVALPMQSLSNNSELLSGSIGSTPAVVATQDDRHFSAIMYARVPSGTAANISMKIGHVSDFVGFPLVYVYRVVAVNLTPVWAESYSNTITPMIYPIANDVTPPRFAVTVAVGQNNNNRDATWATWKSGVTDPAGLIEDSDNSVMNGGAASCAHRGPESSASNAWRISYATAAGSGTRRGLSAATWW